MILGLFSSFYFLKICTSHAVDYSDYNIWVIVLKHVLDNTLIIIKYSDLIIVLFKNVSVYMF